MSAAVAAANARMVAGAAKTQYADGNLKRIADLHARRVKTDDEFEQAKLAQVQSDVDYQQDKLVATAIGAMHAATTLMPKAIGEYIQRKSLTTDVLAQQLAEAAAKLAQSLRNQQRSEMKSPVDGVILERLVSNEGYQASGTVLLKIGQIEQLEVETDILSQDVVHAQTDQRAEVYGPAVRGGKVRATVHRIHPAGFTKVSSLGVEQQRVKVVLRFDATDLTRVRDQRNLGTDYRVRVRIYTAENPKALVMPRSALFRAADGGWQVYAVREGLARLTPVSVGLLNDELVEVTKGLAESDVVVLAPETSLMDGTRVKEVMRD
jgi:HlyD family secretion protein